MAVVYIEDIARYVGQEVRVRGWLRTHRSSGKVQFLTVRDGTGDLQAVVSKGVVGEEQFEQSASLTQESSLILTGTVKADKRAQGGYELEVTRIEPIQIAEPYPIQPKEHGVGFLMEHRHLWLRSSRQHAILRIRHEIIRACRNFFDDRGFVLVDAPIFTPNACEGTTTLFRPTISTTKRISLRAASSIARPRQLRSEKCIALGQPSVPRNQRRGAT